MCGYDNDEGLPSCEMCDTPREAYVKEVIETITEQTKNEYYSKPRFDLTDGIMTAEEKEYLALMQENIETVEGVKEEVSERQPATNVQYTLGRTAQFSRNLPTEMTTKPLPVRDLAAAREPHTGTSKIHPTQRSEEKIVRMLHDETTAARLRDENAKRVAEMEAQRRHVSALRQEAARALDGAGSDPLASINRSHSTGSMLLNQNRHINTIEGNGERTDAIIAAMHQSESRLVRHAGGNDRAEQDAFWKIMHAHSAVNREVSWTRQEEERAVAAAAYERSLQRPPQTVLVRGADIQQFPFSDHSSAQPSSIIVGAGGGQQQNQNHYYHYQTADSAPAPAANDNTNRSPGQFTMAPLTTQPGGQPWAMATDQMAPLTTQPGGQPWAMATDHQQGGPDNTKSPSPTAYFPVAH